VIGVSANRFAEAYKGTPPWDIGRPQPVVVELAESGELTSPVLDVGCGTGENALFLADRGFEVVGVDAAEAAVESARRKAAARALHAEFHVHDALSLEGLGRRFATVVDSGLFHTFDDEERPRFARSLAHALLPGGRYFMLAFSELETGEGGPRRVAQGEIRATFAEPLFRVVSVDAAEMSTRLDGQGRKVWLARIDRVAGPQLRDVRP
jgi:2-polyprenyl-3-methyl-5-hydroxy-6-metoxy-1,4-benzoquinol methylase